LLLIVELEHLRASLRHRGLDASHYMAKM
jgi:hypothetical protein